MFYPDEVLHINMEFAQMHHASFFLPVVWACGGIGAHNTLQFVLPIPKCFPQNTQHQTVSLRVTFLYLSTSALGQGCLSTCQDHFAIIALAKKKEKSDLSLSRPNLLSDCEGLHVWLYLSTNSAVRLMRTTELNIKSKTQYTMCNWCKSVSFSQETTTC